MRFLTVAERELRSAARQKANYHARWITAAVFFGLLVWLLWAFQGMNNRRAGPEVFRIFSLLTFLYCLFLGTARTADAISAERREGTLGLLFLTNLNSAEILAGKLCSTALATVYGLMAIFPMLALPLLMGGVTFELFARTVLVMLNGILFALAAGLLASVLCKRQFTAIALGMGLTVLLAGGLLLGAAVARAYASTRPLANYLACFSPLYSLMAAEGMRLFGPNYFWQSVGAVAGTSVGCLSLTTLLLARTWRDRPKSVRFWQRFKPWRRSEAIPSAKRAALRRRLLSINPLFWLAGRQQVSASVLMCLALVLTLITVYVAAPFFGRVMKVGIGAPVFGHLFAWLWTGAAVHVLVLYYAAMSASQRLAEDKQTGALELILCTPTTERTISRGLWLAYGRKMLFPALLAVLVHCFFIWMCMVMAALDPPGPLPAGATAGEIFWSALLNQPLRGRALDWEFSFLVRIALLMLLLLMVAWLTLGWVGRWLGLRMKHPGFAPMTSLVLVFAPPALLFSLACYLADKFHLVHLPDRQFMPIMMWLAVAIGSGHCLVLSFWAALRLRHQLRPVAMSRYQPLPPWRPRLPSRRAVVRFAVAVGALAVMVPSLVAGYYGYQNWRSLLAWRSFQSALKARGDSLSLSNLFAQPVANSGNLARSPVFLGLLRRTNPEAATVFDRMVAFDLQLSGSSGNAVLRDWSRQTLSPLSPYVTWTRQPSSSGSVGTQRQPAATSILQGLEALDGTLREVAAAAARHPAFQTSTNHDALAVLHPVREPILLLERLHLLFQVRACAALAVGRNADAAEDVLAGLRLARLARQLPDTRSLQRVQGLLTRSLQPLWEGLSQQAWTEAQLATFQHELTGFNLLADYTNAVRRVALAHIEVWRAIPDSTNADVTLPASEGGYRRDSAWQLQPRAWWFENCIQLHSVSQTAMEQVDSTAERIRQARSWSDLSGLPLDYPSRELFQQSWWWGANPGSVAFAQTSVNQAALGCALERFRLVQGGYPETLDKLIPLLLDRIPRDAVSGRPMIYQLIGSDSFILRGVGPNGTDDRNNKTSDDWLWTYSTNTPSAKK